MEGLELLVAIGGWFVAAIMVGLYLGERGRRIDAQRREGKIPVGRTKKAKVMAEASDMTPASVKQDMDEARRVYIRDSVAEGFSEKEAERDWHEMMASASTDQLGVSSPS